MRRASTRVDGSGVGSGILPMLLIISLALAKTAFAQSAGEPTESPGQQYYDEGRQLYRDRAYAEALNALVGAIQADPLDPRYYIGAARAANFADQTDLAVHYYDAYLTHFAEHAEAARRRADRAAAIQRERDEVNQRRATPDVPAQLPASQTAALTALRERLTIGPYMTPNATGAYSMYQTLLRTGFAQPELSDLRNQLINGILTETQALFWPTSESPVPIGDISLWESVPRRYAAVETLGRLVLHEPVIQARICASEGLLANLNANTIFAIERFQLATSLDPNLLVAQIGLLMASHQYAVRQGCCAEIDADTALREVERLIELQAPQFGNIVPLLGGMVETDRGNQVVGAESVIRLLAPEQRTTAPTPPSRTTSTPTPPSETDSPVGTDPDGGASDEEPKPDEIIPAAEIPTGEGLPPAEL